MSTLKAIWECMFTPKLIKIYGNGPVESAYKTCGMEKWGDQILNSLYMLWKLGFYTSPLLAGYLYHEGYFVSDKLVMLTKFVTSLGVILVVSFCIRSFGRCNNETYQNFVRTLKTAQNDWSETNKIKLSKYEFEFYAWPVDYKWNDTFADEMKQKKVSDKPVSRRNNLQLVTELHSRVIGYAAVHTFGIRLIYPGLLGFVQYVLADTLLAGRAALINVNKGVRNKLLTKENNEIDTMFVDKRNFRPNGDTLVICCEGNAGFYEIGVMCTPIAAGYSALGWNHPGFGGSTGMPYPEQEQNAIDVVVQFAVKKLGFKIENILIFGWSIGGYTGAWAAVHYPNVKGLILDATFDDILPLALQQMPSFLESIVRVAIRQYVNLNNSELLVKYDGPVLLIKRTNDEVICTQPGDPSSNRGNYLLMALLRSRYPLLVGEVQLQILKEYLMTSTTDQEYFYTNQINANMCRSLYESYVSEHSQSFPMAIGESSTDQEKNQMVIFLVRQYMKDYQAMHCPALPPELFEEPWDVNVESDYVLT